MMGSETDETTVRFGARMHESITRERTSPEPNSAANRFRSKTGKRAYALASCAGNSGCAVLIAALFLAAGGCGNLADRLLGAAQQVTEDARARRACGTADGIGRLVPDCPLPSLCFTAACQAHDRCYAFCEVERSECDRRFRNDMVAICFQEFPRDLTGLQRCLGLALTYWAAVVELGDSFFPCDVDPPTVDDPRDGPGACCQVFEGPFCESVDYATDCPSGGVFVPSLDCEQVEATFAGCPAPVNDDCANATRVCENEPVAVDPDLGTCTPSSGVDGDRVCSISRQDCPGRSACLIDNRDAMRCTVLGDTRLAQTDGPPADGACLDSGADRFRADVWYEYEAPCSGSLTVQLCEGTSYDAMAAVYGSNEPNGACLCPDDVQASLACDDDSCSGPGGPPVITYSSAVAGACYLIRVGGWSSDGTDAGASRGLSQLQIGMVCNVDNIP